MIRKIMETAGFMLISNSLLFTPIVAHAEGNGAIGAVVGGALGGLVTGGILVSMSKTKFTATRAEKYVDGDLDLKNQQDHYLRTTRDKTKVN